MKVLIILSVVLIVALYISILRIYIRHRFYFNLLLIKDKSYEKDKSFTRYRSLQTRIAPMYRKEYFGYEYLVLSEHNNDILYPYEYMRVYGIIRPYSNCLVFYKGDVVKTVISLDDKRYADILLEEFRKDYKTILIVLNGGVLFWKICLTYII